MRARLTVGVALMVGLIGGAGAILSQVLQPDFGEIGRKAQEGEYAGDYLTALRDANNGFRNMVDAFGLVIETARGEVTIDDLQVRNSELLRDALVYYRRSQTLLEKLPGNYDPPVSTEMRRFLIEQGGDYKSTLDLLLQQTTAMSERLNGILEGSDPEGSAGWDFQSLLAQAAQLFYFTTLSLQMRPQLQ